MYINQQALNIIGINYEEYLQWCYDNNKAPYKKKVRKDFFARIKDGRIVRNTKTGLLVNKRIKNREEIDEDIYYEEENNN